MVKRKLTIEFSFDPVTKYSWEIKGTERFAALSRNYKSLANLLIDPHFIEVIVNHLEADTEEVKNYLLYFVDLATGIKRSSRPFVDDNSSNKRKRAIISFTYDPICDYMWKLQYKRKWEGICCVGGGPLGRLLADYDFLYTLTACLGGGIPQGMLKYAKQRQEQSIIPFASEQIDAIEEWSAREDIPFTRK